MLILWTDVDQKWLETEFSIAICHLTGDKWQLKTLFLAILDLHSSIVKSVFDCRLSGLSVGFRLFYDCVLIWRIFSHLEGPY